LRVALAVLAAAVVLVVGARAGRGARSHHRGSGDVPGPNAERFGEPYVGEAPIRVGDALVASGQPMEASVFQTTDPPARVIGFYEAAFRARGMVPLSRSTALLGHVSGFDNDGRQRFATALATGRGDTIVLVGAADPRHVPRFRPASREAQYPLPPRSRAFVASAAEDGGARAETAQFVTASTPDAVLAFYRGELGRQGHEETSLGDGFSSFANHDGDLVTVAVRSLDAGASAVFLVRARRR
jgi:hypothetical protein